MLHNIHRPLIYKLTSGSLSFLICACFLLSCKQAPKTVDNTASAWYKNQLIYNLDIKVFKDSDGDGVGDIRGLTSKLGYLDSLGVSTIWLAPFQPSPLEDDGYDITDYYSIDPRVGNNRDLAAFMAAAKQHNMKVIMDIVLNHTSIKHPWFIQSAADSASSKRNWYLWSKKRPNDWDKGMGFPKVDKETWLFQPQANAYYFHRFYKCEPDLNFQNPQVMKEAEHIITYWLDKGMDGFRFDAVPFIIDDPRKSSEKPAFDFKLLHQIAGFVKKKKPDAVILGEANIDPKENKNYLARNNDGLDMMFNFHANEFMFYALATGKAAEFNKALTETAEKPPKAQWAYFLRNHDEVDIGKLSKSERKEVYDAMGPDTTMQLYDRGIRRRLAPMLNNNPERLRMAYSLLFGLPGTPVIRYGEELGMGDDLSLKERLAVRTPMQWNGGRNSGFSTAQKAFRPLIASGAFDYKMINVSNEELDANSLLNFIRKMAGLRKQYPQIGEGKWQVLDGKSDNVLVLLYTSGKQRLLMCYNFEKDDEQAVVSIKGVPDQVKELISDKTEKVLANGGNLKIKLPAYGYKWYKL
jgi:maltose alpha-D-glucosyltransferase/alpha-amylase